MVVLFRVLLLLLVHTRVALLLLPCGVIWGVTVTVPLLFLCALICVLLCALLCAVLLALLCALLCVLPEALS